MSTFPTRLHGVREVSAATTIRAAEADDADASATVSAIEDTDEHEPDEETEA